MDFVFVHGNYPAQFRFLAGVLAANPRHRVYYLTARKDADQFPIRNVNIVPYEAHRKPHEGCHPYLVSTEEAVLNGQAVLRKLMDLRGDGVKPAIIVTHGGNGLGFFVKHACPPAKHVSYMEWFFRPETSHYLFKDFDINHQLLTHIRNLSILSEAESADAIVVPTQWQWQQFPSHYSYKTKVIFDGVDVSFFSPHVIQGDLALPVENESTVHTIPAECRLLTYCTRGMEPLRGFPEFMRLLPELMADFPDLHVVIAGQDRSAYSYGSPASDRSWKTFMLEELGAGVDRSRLHFTGLLNSVNYRSLLCRSDLHCYFSRPYVTSWSLFEAAACGAKLMVNRSPAMDGIIEPGDTLWVNLEDQRELIDTARAWLQDAPNRRYQQRPAMLKPGFTVKDSLGQWDELFRKLLVRPNDAASRESDAA